MANLTSVLNQLEQERTRLTSHIQGLNHALAALKGTSRSGTRTMSASARRRIAAAQKARWAEWRRAQKKS